MRRPTPPAAPPARRSQRRREAAAERARDDAALFARRAAGDPHAREALIERFLPLARSVARRYESSGESLEDLVQVASLGFRLEDLVGAPDAGFDRAEARVLLGSLMPALSPRSQEVLRLRFEEDMTQQQIGELLSLSQMQISRILHDVLDLFRELVDGQPIAA